MCDFDKEAYRKNVLDGIHIAVKNHITNNDELSDRLKSSLLEKLETKKAEN